MRRLRTAESSGKNRWGAERVFNYVWWLSDCARFYRIIMKFPENAGLAADIGCKNILKLRGQVDMCNRLRQNTPKVR